jgi:hypothetical protein
MCSTVSSVLVGVAILLFSSCSTAKKSGGGELREEAPVSFGGSNEVWRLEWMDKPKEACAPRNEESGTCPCAGFAYAEYGRADLVRIQGGKEIDRFHLMPLFESEELPVDGAAAVIQRWPIDRGDFSETPPSGASIRKRPPVKLMDIADYNHDGWASEFVLQIGTSPCAHKQAVLVGVTPDKPVLHVYGTLKSPEKPLVLEPEAWVLLKNNRHDVRYVSIKCGDHGSDEQTEIILSSEKNGIRAFQETFECMNDFKKGKRVKRSEL